MAEPNEIEWNRMELHVPHKAKQVKVSPVGMIARIDSIVLADGNGPALLAF